MNGLGLPLKCGGFTLVDEDVYNTYKGYSLRLKDNGYVLTGKKGNSTLLHRQITGAKQGQSVDHINGNKLDNRRENLRIVTHKENNINVGLTRNNTSGYKGVSRSRKKWRVTIYNNYKQEFLGTFSCRHCAGLKYNERAKELYGGYAYLNPVNHDHKCEKGIC